MITVTVRFNEANLLGGTSQNEIDAINIDATVNKLFSEITDDVRKTFSDAELHLNLEYGQYAGSSMNIDVDDDNIAWSDADIRDFINEIVERRYNAGLFWVANTYIEQIEKAVAHMGDPENDGTCKECFHLQEIFGDEGYWICVECGEKRFDFTSESEQELANNDYPHPDTVKIVQRIMENGLAANNAELGTEFETAARAGDAETF